MEDTLRFLEQIEIWVYAAAALVAVYHLRKMIIAWQEWRGAIFGIERETAQRRFSTSMTVVILLAIFAMAEFILVSFVTPSLPQASVLPTPTLDLLATASPAAPAAAAAEGTPQAPTPVVISALATVPAGDCIPGQIEWIDPINGAEISGTVTLKGTVNVSNFGFYKYEFSQPGSNIWEIVAGGNTLVTTETGNGVGVWSTGQLMPGDYLLRLVVYDNESKNPQSCVISVRILAQE